MKRIYSLFLILALVWANWIMAADGYAQSITTIYSFNTNGSSGINPFGLILGPPGNFYGLTSGGGSGSSGTIFTVSFNGDLTTLYSFAPLAYNSSTKHSTNSDGAFPNGVTIGSDGALYGTTQSGGLYSGGTVFKMTTNGLLTSLTNFYAFGVNYNPNSELTIGSDGLFYGTSYYPSFSSTIFYITSYGTVKTLGGLINANGSDPTGLTVGPDGSFYGTAYSGGSYTGGTVFKVTTSGILTKLHDFYGNDNVNGVKPMGLTLGTDNNFYGITCNGGSMDCGTVFRITTNGVLTTLTSFNGANGMSPETILTLGPDGCFYGTTYYGGYTNLNSGGRGFGTVFKVTTNGTLTSLITFDGTNGAFPLSSLILHPHLGFYGTTGNTIYRLNLGPSFISSPTDQNVSVGGTAIFNCDVFATPNYSFQWFSNGIPMVGAAANQLTLPNVTTQANNSQLYVVVTNNWGGITSSVVTLKVFLPTTILTQPSDQTVNLGNTFSFSIQASGQSPLAFQWYFNGKPISNAVATNYSFVSASLTNAGTYYVVITNAYNSVTSSVATLTVLGPPIFTIQPQSQTVMSGSNVAFTVAAIGVLPLKYQWSFNSSMLAGVTNSSLALSNVALLNQGSYSVSITNAYGTVTSSNAVLTVISPPVILQSALSQSQPIGNRVTFAPVVQGTAPLGFQWFFQNSSISGAASSTLTLGTLKTNQAGGYSFIVTNAYGNATSAVATLTVLLQPNSYGLTNVTATNATVQLASIPGSTNRLWASTNLQNWQVVGTVIVDGNGFVQFTDTNIAKLPGRYYRLSNP